MARDDLGKLFLRLGIGGMLLFHGIAKIRFGVDSIEGMLEARDLPTVLAYGAYVGEVAAPALVVIGLFTRLAGLVIVANMGMALFLAHADDLLKVNPDHGGWAVELAMLYLVGGLAIALLGSGRLAVKPGGPRPAPAA